jgi:hypothetical protein
MSLRSRLALFGSFIALGTAPSIAHAQSTVSVMITNPMSLPRYNPDGSEAQKRATISPEGINQDDCHNNLLIGFPLTTMGFSTSDSFEVWATDQSGADCTVATARTGATQTCYRLTNANFARTQTQTVTIPVKDIIKGLPNGNGSFDAQGCRLVRSYTITVFFLVLRGTDVAGNDKASLKVSTQGPSSLNNVHALPGNNAIIIQWDLVGEGGAEDIAGAVAYCDPTPMVATSVDAGTHQECADTGTADADADVADAMCTTVANEGGAGGPIPTPSTIPSEGTSCNTQAFATGGTGTGTMRVECGHIDSTTGNSIRIEDIGGVPLENGKVYAVAVAAKDSLANVGDLSAPICQYPEATTDFWRDYRSAGGQSGGGFCSVEGPGLPVGSFTLMGIGAVLGISAIRRVKRNRRGRNEQR